MRAIEFKNVSFCYEDMPESVLKNASFSLEYGRLALLYGDSGQGKSTVLSILSGVIPNVTKGTLSGEVRIGGEDVSGQRISDICRRAGVVLQNADAQIIHQRVEDELAFGCENFAFSPEKIGGCIEKACDRMALCPQWGTRTLSGRAKAAADHRICPGHRAEDSPFRRAAGKPGPQGRGVSHVVAADAGRVRLRSAARGAPAGAGPAVCP